MNYQNIQVEFYQSGLRRISEAKRVKMLHSFKLTPQEQDAFDYFKGMNFLSDKRRRSILK